MCCEAGGTVSENKTQTVSVSTLVKKVIIKFLLFNDLLSYIRNLANFS